MDYQWEKLLEKKGEDVSNWQSKFGASVSKRDEKGIATHFKVNLYVDTMPGDIYIVGSFNDWEKEVSKLENYKLEKFNGFASIEIKASHLDEYKFYVSSKKKFYQDPTGFYFNDLGNTIFWDFEDPSSYKKKHSPPRLNGKSLKILQTDLPGLIAHYNSGEELGSDIHESNYYEFIAKSSVIKEIKSLGFNAVQFLPFAQSIDGSNWKYRYLVPFQFAIQKNWGTPNQFKKMIDMFHKEGIAVIGDFVVGHVPHKDFKIFGQDFEDNGLHVWKKESKDFVYLKDDTSWGTKRLDYDNPLIREFFVDACLSFYKHYGVDGFRIDNVDGIIRYGESGEGPERENGRVFLKELCSKLYKYNPEAIISFEAHYFFEDNAKMLVSPINSDDRALGATAYNDSRLSYYFHKIYMLEKVDNVSAWKFKHIIDEKEWGKSNSTICDFHNHDAAAGLMHGRATGSYAYDAMTQDKGNHFHAVGKIKVMEAIISFMGEGRTLDLLQTFLLQTGTFEHDSSIHWFLTFNEANKNLVSFKKEVNFLMDNDAFWPLNLKNRKVLNVDEKNKVLVIKREGKNSFIIVINLSAWTHHKYKVGVDTNSDFEVLLNSDEFKYSGFGLISYPKILKNNASNNFEVLDRELELPMLSPYGVLVLKEKK
ncbi:MAG: alpha-amylase family glycosyl hydrolase [Candidatus Woesearchaeota archaeon]